MHPDYDYDPRDYFEDDPHYDIWEAERVGFHDAGVEYDPDFEDEPMSETDVQIEALNQILNRIVMIGVYYVPFTATTIDNDDIPF
jgi:hypothetical protein